ncbi:hypothetical protein GCM10027422_28560 [Hymenobacter arcticus]
MLLLNAYQSWGQTPYPLASGTYTESFENISGWTNNFASGIGANRFGVASPNPTLPTTNTVFVTNTAGGVQKGNAAIVLLATGATGGQNASAFDLYLDFSNSTAGTISLDYAEVNNSTGDRQSTFKLQTNTGTSGSFVDLPGSSVVITNNVAASGSLTNIALPAAFTNNPSAKVRFFVITSNNGTAGSRPKVSLDNVVVTAGGGTTPTPTAAVSTTSGAYSSPYCITSIAGSATFNVAFSSSNVADGSTFAAQLSDASGFFPTDLTQNLIGSGTSSPIAASIPKNTPSGTVYRIRVVSGTLASANDNSTNLTVTLAPTTNSVNLSSTTAQTFTTNTNGTAITATASVPSTYAWYYGTSAGGPYGTAVSGATAATYQPKGSDFPSAGTYYLVARATSSCGSVEGTSTQVQLTIISAAAAFTPSVTGLPDFGSLAVGSTSTVKSFTVSATTLSGPLIITPPTGFEIRTGATAFACCPIQLTPDANGNIPATTIDVRFAPLAAQPYNAQVALTTSGLPEQDVAVAGTGTTPIYPAVVASTAPTNVGKTFATAGGNVLEDGGSPVTARGVVFGYEPDPTLSSGSVAAGNGLGIFTAQLTGLLPDSIYYVRAYATNALGTSYGEQFTFTTLPQPLDAEPATPSTITASNQRPTRVLLTLSGGQPGVKHLVLARLNGPVAVKPRDATAYAANPSFGQGQLLGTASYVVLSAAQDTVTVRGLRPNTPYSFAVYDYTDLDGTPYAQNYLTSAADSLTLTTPALPPTLLLREDFEYAAGTALTANGWTAHSGAGSAAIAVTANGPTYPGYSDGKGNAAALRTSGEDVSRQFPTVYPRTAVYLSFVVTVSSVSTAGDYFLHLGPTTLSGNFRPRVFVRQAATGNAIQFGVSDNGAAFYTTATYSLNTPYLLLVKYNFDETGTTTELYVNPDPQSSSAYRLSADPDVSVSGTTSPSDIGTLALRQGGSSPALVVDDIQLATAFPLTPAPLPVTLTKFTAQASGRTVQLAWQTASEVNSDHFVVERSLDGRTFAPLQSVPAAGSSTTPRTYTALDAQAQATGAPLLYYRLRSVDHDGTSSYSAVQTVALTSAAAGLALFPNPTTNAITTLIGAGASARIQVIDALGRTVLTTTADATGAAELKLPAGIASGVYVVRTGTQALRLMVK